jgi:ABC-type transport system involved in multi-copper enzyme maturation permease subunit
MNVPALARNETIKLRHYVPTLVTLGIYVGILVLGFGEMHRRSIREVDPRPFALPTAWNQILGELLGLSVFFFCVLLILLIANEFTWRTARQNVIDGLAKEEWFLGKMLLVAIVGSVFFLPVIVIGGFIASLGDDSAVAGPIVRAADLKVMGAFALSLLGYGSLTLLIATLVRSAGSALGIFFLYTVLLERLLGLGLRYAFDRGSDIAGFLPTILFDALTQRLQWDPDALAALAAAAAAAGQPVPDLMSAPVLLAAATSWTIAFTAIAFVVFRRRDL